MTERDPHPDNELIDELTAEAAPGQADSAGGNVARNIGKRDELARATDPDNREPVVGSDNPADDARKGEKTSEAIRRGQQG